MVWGLTGSSPVVLVSILLFREYKTITRSGVWVKGWEGYFFTIDQVLFIHYKKKLKIKKNNPPPPGPHPSTSELPPHPIIPPIPSSDQNHSRPTKLAMEFMSYEIHSISDTKLPNLTTRSTKLRPYQVQN